jgi:hypothetical protein
MASVRACDLERRRRVEAQNPRLAVRVATTPAIASDDIAENSERSGLPDSAARFATRMSLPQNSSAKVVERHCYYSHRKHPNPHEGSSSAAAGET